MKDETSSVNMHYVGFVDTCVQMGMSKEAADRLYKSALPVGIVSRAAKTSVNALGKGLRPIVGVKGGLQAAKNTISAFHARQAAEAAARKAATNRRMILNFQKNSPRKLAPGIKPQASAAKPAVPEVVTPEVLPPARSMPVVRSARMPVGDVIDAEYRMLPATRSQALGGLSRGSAHRLSLENTRGFEAGPRPRLRGGVPPQRPTPRRVSRIKVPEGTRRPATQQLAAGQAPVTQAVMHQAPESLGMLARHPYLTLAGGALAGYGLNRFVNRDN